MEEEEATRYYDELVRKGENAAKFKQGLGFGTHTTSVINSEAHGSLSNFVKKASPGRAAALDKEIRIESVRGKLKKREDYSSRVYHSSRQSSRDDDGKKSSNNKTPEEHKRGKTLDSYESEDARRKSGYRRRSSSDRTERAPATKKSSEKERKSRSRKISTSPSDDDGKTGASELNRKTRERRERSSRSRSSENSTRSSERRKRNRRSERDRSLSPIDDCRSRHRSKNSVTGRNDSPSRSYEGRRRDRSRSRSRGRDAGYSRRRERAYSPYESHRRGGSRSPSSPRGSYNNRRDRRFTGRPENRHVDSSRRRNEDDRREERSSGMSRDEITESAAHSRGSREKANPPKRDFSKLIPNFQSMTPAEKVKAKMKLQLSETGLWDKDQAKGEFDEWERFDFDKNAPLDDDAKLDYFGDGTGAKDDSLFLKNTGSTYLSSSSQVKREALMTAAHEAAIFGPAQGLSLEMEREAVAGENGCDGGGSRLSNSGVIDKIIIRELKDPEISSPPLNSVVSDQVIAMQQAGSWQERARKMRVARDAALTS